MCDSNIGRVGASAEPADVVAHLATLKARLQAAEAAIAMLNDRLAWAEAELAAQPVSAAHSTRQMAVAR